MILTTTISTVSTIPPLENRDQWLDKTALLGGDLGKVFRILQLGLSSQEHQTFLETLSGH